MEKLFSYGSLRNEEIQGKLFRRKLFGQQDILSNYEKGQLELEGKKFNTANQKVRSVIEGTIYDLTESELKRADKYEGKLYKRIKVILKSGTESWIYLIK